MIKEYKKRNSSYGKYFLSLFQEADDDENNYPANRKIINAKPDNRRRFDYTSLNDDEDNTTNDVQTDGGANNDDTVNEDDNNQPAEDTTQDDTNDGDQNTEDDTDYSDDTSDNDDTNDTNQDGNDDETVINADDGDDASNDTTDYSDDGNGDDNNDGNDDNQDNTNDDQNQDDDKKGPGIEYDSTRKYILFNRFINLITSLDNYINKLENSTTDNININRVIEIAVDKLRDIRNLAYDYTTIKFEASTYVQSLLFYNQLIVMTEMIFELLNKSKKKIKDI